MAKRAARAPASTPSSSELRQVLKRVGGSSLSPRDKRVVSDMLAQNIKLQGLLERATVAYGKKKVLASLPFGFDIVK